MVAVVSAFPAALDVLGAEVATLPLPDVAERLGQPVTRIHQMLRDGQLLAVRRDGVTVVPEDFLNGDSVVKGLGGTITLLRDAGYTEDDMVRWLFAEDDSLPGTAIGALRSDRGREVKRRAQALGF